MMIYDSFVTKFGLLFMTYFYNQKLYQAKRIPYMFLMVYSITKRQVLIFRQGTAFFKYLLGNPSCGEIPF